MYGQLNSAKNPQGKSTVFSKSGVVKDIHKTKEESQLGKMSVSLVNIFKEPILNFLIFILCIFYISLGSIAFYYLFISTFLGIYFTLRPSEHH